MADIQLLLEAERRGILPADKLGLLTEARNRGLVPPLDQPKAGDLVSQIPGTNIKAPPSTAAPERPESGFFGKLMSPLETVVTLGTSAITAPIVESAKVFGTLTSGKFGTQEGIRAGEETGRRVQQFFQPQVSPESERQTAAISNALARTGLQGVPLNMLGDISTLARPAAQQVAPAIKAPIEARQQRVREQRIRESEMAAPRIDAAKDAVDLGLALDPSISNPSAAARLRTAAVGSTALQGNLSKLNLPKVATIAKQDMGLPETTTLNAKAFETARNAPEISGAYDKVRSIPRVAADDAVLGEIDNLRVTPTIGDTGQAAAINNFLDTVKTQLQSGADGKTIVNSIRQLRRDAQAIYNQQSAGINPPSPEAIARADVNMGIAKALETAIENSIADPKLVADFRNARTALARTYDYERATNLATGVVDPQALANLAAEGRPLSGKLQQLANVAANFPEVMQGGVVREPSWREKLTRSGVAGTLGGFIGSPLGLGGAIAGGAVGAGVGNVAAAVAARRIASPQYQRQRALPTDYRPIPSGLTPAEINYGPNQLAPYDWRRAPNFVMVPKGEAPAAAPQFPQLPAPSYESTINALRAEDVRRAGVSRTLGQQAEARAAAAETAANKGKRTTNRAMNLEWDPVAQVYREAAPQGAGGVVGGLTPLESAVQKMSGQMVFEPKTQYETVQTGSYLNRAPMYETRPTETLTLTPAEAKKYALPTRQGQAFAMTAEEKIAWNKAKADLAEVMPGMKSLPDEAIAAKMMDRDFAAQVVANARAKAEQLALQEAKLAEQLANRDNLRLMAREIEAKQKQLAKIKADRAGLRDLAEQMEEGLRAPRPDISTKQQGPKTRAAIRNRLIGGDNTNNLAP